MTLTLGESQAFLAKQAQLWQDQSIRLSETSQDLQWLRDEEAQAVLQLEAEKVLAMLERQLDAWSRAAKGDLDPTDGGMDPGMSMPAPEPKNFRDRMLAMGAAPVLGFQIQADSLAKHRASLHPTDGRAAADVQAAASSADEDRRQAADPPLNEPLRRGRSAIPAQQRTSEPPATDTSVQNELASVFARRQAASMHAAG